jgi:hypothetical protein
MKTNKASRIMTTYFSHLYNPPLDRTSARNNDDARYIIQRTCPRVRLVLGWIYKNLES